MKMFRKLSLTTMTALALSAGAVHAAGAEAEITNYDFPFEGPFGSFDTNQLQRGLKVYTQICSACHGMEYVAFRTLSDEHGPALPEDQMRAYAENFEIFDPALDDGLGDYRPATPADHYPESSLANAPDLSLMAKSRAGFHGPYGTGISQFINGMGGAEYIASLMTGYHEEPECALEMDVPMDGYYNVAFANGGFPDECKDEHGHYTVPGSWISMAPPLYGDDIDFDDGTEATLEQSAKDVAAFLMWTAEPKMMARKQAGLTGVVFLSLLAALLYLTNKKLWAPHKKRVEDE
ncbi:cytochrome c1 [Loktanella sp. SALINAS62]|uniref:cytochrome c1 n=1 Tax=Loktanella sp. SALINAS62 TaxID=2706124 RepID=UPI001B8CC313|nr:cytochrome c1 [Loktanella sp. SALINAS62]MBS1302264.1 cytochrome c1 [Loktanella sp. SALINAS62]